MHYIWLLIVIICSCPCFAQKSILNQTKQGIESGYVNEIVSYDSGYFVLLGKVESVAGGGFDDIVITKFNDCHDELWSRAYHCGTDVGVDDAKLDGERLVLLIDAYPNNLLLVLGLDGEVIFCNKYIYGTHDCFYKLTIVDDLYQIVGHAKDAAPTTPKGAVHMKIDRDGNFQGGTVLLTSQAGTNWSGPPYGSGFLSNGTLLRKQGNIYINVDDNDNVLWAKHYDIDGYGLSETAPTNIADGFLVTMKKNTLTCVVKLDFDGQVVWTSDYLNLHYHSPELSVQDDIITVVSTEDLEIIRPAVIKLDLNTGQLISSKSYLMEEYNGLSFSEMLVTKSDDLVISGSVLIDFSEGEWEDMLIINPKSSPCFVANDIPSTASDGIDIIEELDDHFGLIPITVLKEPFNMNDQELEPVYFRKCISIEEMQIDTALNCNGRYTFNNPFPDARYLWSDGNTDSVRIFDEAANLSVEIETCREVFQMEIIVRPTDCECEVYIPNVIEPNGFQTINQSFKVFSNCELEEYSLSIYDRWGSLVFSSNIDTEGWDGRLNDKSLSNGVYTYILGYSTLAHPNIKHEAGQLTVIK